MKHSKKIAFSTLGCRLNIAETETLMTLFKSRGYLVVENFQDADLIVINTCTVTNSADSSSRNIIRKANRENPRAHLIVVGCYAQMAAKEIIKMDGVALVLGAQEKNKILEYLDQLEASAPSMNVDRGQMFYGAESGEDGGHTRAFLKIQDGCNYFCSYCIIPHARGGLRSIAISEAVQKVERLVGIGFKEIVLTGVNIGEFHHGNDQGETLLALLQAIVGVAGLQRLRLSSIEPNTIDDKLLDFIETHPVILPYFHIPLQNGDAEILRKMERRYSLRQYQLLAEKIRTRFPHAGIGTDVIVGFPGETDQQFSNTRSYISDLPLTHLHVFSYSIRNGTAAALFPDQVHGEIKKARARELIALGKEKFNTFAFSLLGREISVLFEQKNADGYWMGHSAQFYPVRFKSDENLQNQIRVVRAKTFSGDYFVVE